MEKTTTGLLPGVRLSGRTRAGEPDLLISPRDARAEQMHAQFCDAVARYCMSHPVLAASLTEIHALSPLPQFGAERNGGVKSDVSTVRDLCRTFETLYHDDARTKEGIVYTPQSVVQHMVSQVLGRGELPRAVLDPSCGAGTFLLEMVEQATSVTSIDRVLRFAAEGLYGVDKDPFAVDAARMLLAISLVEKGVGVRDLPDLSLTIRCGNFLLDPDECPLTPDDSAYSPLSLRDSFSTVLSRGGFDVVLGNPPYGLSRGEKISEREKQLLARRFERFRSGKLDKYIAFTARGYELLSDGGVLTFIVPNAWLGIENGRRLRALFAEEESLETITILPGSVFTARNLEPVIFRAHKGVRHGEIRIERRDVECSLETSHELSYDCIRAHPALLIPSRWMEGLSELFVHVERISLRLGDEGSRFVPRIALQAYRQGGGDPPQTAETVKTHPFHTREPDQVSVPYLEGADVERFRISWSGSYLRYGPWLAEYQDIARFRAPRVLVREITGRAPRLLIACATAEQFTYNRSVLHVLPTAGTCLEQMEALSVIFNSTLASVIVGYRGRKTQRTVFPKIVRDDLSDFPIPSSFEKHVPTLARLARAIAREETRCTLEEIDAAVLEAYEIPDEWHSVVHRAAVALGG